MGIVILDSAYKHGVSEESIRFCLSNVRGGELIGDPPPKRLLTGFDHMGKALELGVTEDDEATEAVLLPASRKGQSMNYDEINADKMLAEIDTAIAEGRSRRLTEQELLKIRIAANESIVHDMQETIEKDYQLDKVEVAHL